MISLINRLWRRRDGAILAYTAILMPIFLGFIALGLDIAFWHVSKRQIQTMADSAAMAAAVENARNDPDEFSSSELQAFYEAAALDAATRNGYDAGTGDTIEINSPPTLGDSAGNVNAIEVIVRTPLPLFLSALVTEDGKFASARAVATLGSADSCLFALNEEDSGTITIAGGASVSLGCGVLANSSDANAINVVGGGCLTATEVAAVGGTSGDCIDPEPTATVVKSDPLGAIPEPSWSGCDYNARINVTGHSDQTLSPGVYCNDISITTDGTVTFLPGTYIFDGGGVNIGAQATAIGSDVFFFFSENDSQSDNFSIAGGANVTFDAPDSGTYEGIFFFESRSSPDGINHNFTGGTNMNIDGIIYARNADINFSGGSETASNTFIVADTISFTGQSTLTNLDPDTPPAFDSPYFINVDLIE